VRGSSPFAPSTPGRSFIRPFTWTRDLTLTSLALAATVVAGPCLAAESVLSEAEVRRVLQQAAAGADAAGLKATIAVTDRQGNVLGVFRMNGAPTVSVVPGTRGQGLEGLSLPSDAVAITKAGSGALLSSGGNAFSTRTASFIVQDHFPPGVRDTPGGPLFGVQFSSLPCTDFKRPALPLGLSGDPGGQPLYKDGALVGGVGVEGDGSYGVDRDPTDDDLPVEEQAALAGARGFEPPFSIRADRILADGVRLPFANGDAPSAAAGGAGTELVAPRAGQPTTLVPLSLVGVAGQTDPRYPIRAGSALSAADVRKILEQGAAQTALTRGAIRQPIGSSARVSITVVDTDGSILGFFQNEDAPNFGIDVSAQKARTANFFSHPQAGNELRAAGFAIYVRDVPLDGSVAYTSRAVGFLAQPFFPPGISGTISGPFSVPSDRDEWSPFNTGLQLDVVSSAVLGGVAGRCSASLSRLPNGITIFPGGVPLYRNGVLIGAVGVSGDGVDQDDLVASAASAGFEAPAEKRSDQLVLRGVRLPFVKFPRHPEL
jgi:uncharacterized protein GlcG (DUF336 family)